GYDLRALQRLIALPYQINVAILPDAPHAKKAARMAHQHGITVMLHMPMQTANPKYQQKMERFYLHNQMSKDEFRSVFEAALAKVPYVEGINNHMGSLLTSNKKYMKWLMELCKKHHIFFIDSRTAASSVAAAQAEKAGIPWNQRDVFLDHKVDPKSLQHAWHTAASCLSEKSNCIIIGHPHKETINFLEHHAQGIDTQSFVAIDTLLHK
ncbi:MAG: divergent polysaccharide deacetylase family protein, partial [Ghiorsea sp.]